MSKFADPENYPSLWFALHILAKRAKTKELEKIFAEELTTIVSNLKCGECRQHGLKHLSNNPIHKYYGIKDKNGNLIGMFKYTVDFHNAVNARLGKKIIDWETAWQMYEQDTDICTADCGHNASGNGNSTGRVNNSGGMMYYNDSSISSIITPMDFLPPNGPKREYSGPNVISKKYIKR